MATGIRRYICFVMSYSSDLIFLVTIFFIIALLYSSVGFGGGSSYLAILSIYVPDFLQVKTIALLSNLVVVSAGTYLFYKQGYFDQKKFLPLVICSIPAAFIAATIHIAESSFFILLGVVLTLSGILLVLQMFVRPSAAGFKHSDAILFNLSIGGGVGFLSGLVGIGGGILLSPILNLLNWDNAKKIAALASFFILVNSVAGLCGQAVSHNLRIDVRMMLPLLTAVFVGGQLGTRLSLKLLRPSIVKGLTGIFVCYVGVKLILKYSYSIEI